MADRDQNGHFTVGNRAATGRVSKQTLALAAAIAKRGAAGVSGVWSPGGFLYDGEKDPKLQGRTKWVTQDNLIANVAIVASAIGIWLNLGGSVKWSAKPNKRGGRNARKCVDLVTDGLIEARMSDRWRAVVRRQLMKKFRGFSMHAKAFRRDSMGRQVYAALEHRPQWSVERWWQENEGDPWYAITQRARSGKETQPIPREMLFYSVENAIADNFAGMGLLRHLVKLANTLEGFEELERIGFDTDMRGMAVGRAPLAKLAAEAVQFGGVAANDTKGIQTYVTGQVKFLADLLSNHIVTKDRSVMFDSAVYNATATDGGISPTSTYEWSIDTVKTQMSGMPELGTAIGRVVRDMARVLCAEWLLLGGEDSGGAYSMHEDKTSMFGLVVESSLDDVQDDAERDLVWPLVARNGYNPETDAPTLVREPIPTQSLLEAAQTLVLIRQAGLLPGDEAGNRLRDRMGMPPEPKIDPSAYMAPGRMPPDVRSQPPADDGGKAPADDTPDDPNDKADAIPEGDA